MNGPGCISAAMAVLLVECTTPAPTSSSTTPDSPNVASRSGRAQNPSRHSRAFESGRNVPPPCSSKPGAFCSIHVA